MYTFHFFVCLNHRDSSKQCCFKDGNEEIVKALKVALKKEGVSHCRVNKAGCLGRCSDGPVTVLYPHNIWLKLQTPKDAKRAVKALAASKALPTDIQISTDV